MNKWILKSALFSTLLLGLGATAGTNANADEPLKVGTFDSRAVALAYYRTDEFKSGLSEMKVAYDEAKATGDEAQIKRFEEEGPALQDLMHRRVFSTWPIDEIMTEIESDVSTIAADANVVMVVSKWDVVFQKEGFETVDLTMDLVKLFDPSEETLKIAEDLLTKAPVSLDDLKDH